METSELGANRKLAISYENPFLSKVERAIYIHNKGVKFCPPKIRWWRKRSTHVYKTGWLADKTRVNVCQKCGAVKLDKQPVSPANRRKRTATHGWEDVY